MTTTPRVRLSGPAQMIAAVPYLIGFRPEESIVAVGVSSASQQVSLTMRVDLPQPADVPELADLIATHLEHAGAEQAVLVLLTEEAGAELPRWDLVEATAAALAERGVGLRDALCERAGRWWSYLCAEPECCPPQGTPVDPAEAAEIAAMTAWLGDVVHESRAELAATLAPGEPIPSDVLERAQREFGQEVIRRGRKAVAARSRKLVRKAVLARVEHSPQLTPDRVARLALGLTDVLVRDSCLGWAGTGLEHAAEALWVELVRRSPAPYAAAPATMLAVHAYLRGNGGYARIALDRALDSDPDYSFARLLEAGLDRGVPPGALRAALAIEQAAA